MRNELLSWFAREGLLLTDVVYTPDDEAYGEGEQEVKITVKAPMIALSRAMSDVRECLDPVLFGYPESSLDLMTLDDMHQFVYQWFERAVDIGMARCFVCNHVLDMGNEHPWDAVFVTKDLYCWLVVHYDCKRYLARDLKGRHPFELSTEEPEFFDMRLT
jgi:hypothetical protein